MPRIVVKISTGRRKILRYAVIVILALFAVNAGEFLGCVDVEYEQAVGLRTCVRSKAVLLPAR